MSIGNSTSHIVGFLINVLLARLMAPRDFGSVAIISSFVAILQILGEMGITVAVIQIEKVDEKVKHTAFWLSFVFSLAVAATMFFLSPYMSAYFKNEELAALFKIVAISYFFRGIYSFFNCLLLRDMKYNIIVGITIISMLLNGVISVVFAMQGLGAYSIVNGQLAASLISVILGFYFTRFRIKLLWSFLTAKTILSYGVVVAFNRLIANLAGKIDAIIIGRAIGVGELGQYYLAQKIVFTVPTLIRGPLDQVLLPSYSRLQNAPEKIEEGYWKSLLLSATISLPPVCLLFLLSDSVVFLFYGKKWMSMAPILRILSINSYVGCFGSGLFSSVLYAQKKQRTMTIISVYRLVSLPSALLIGSFWGVTGAAWGFAIHGIFGRAFSQFVLKFSLNYSLTKFISTIAKPFVSSIVATILTFFLVLKVDCELNVMNHLLKIALTLVIWMFLYGLQLVDLWLPWVRCKLSKN